jgi:iron complex outermembrane receptor protein
VRAATYPNTYDREKIVRYAFTLVLAAVTAANCQALEEILVQAQHREESLVEVPISITVLDGEDLQRQGMTRIEDFTALAPGLSGWEQGVSTPIYAIRGISTNSFGIGGEASVAVIVDDSYVGRINSTSLSMVDVNRVEVLRGPQGTLFGRNATAGAIVIYNNQPVDRFEGSYRLEAGEDHQRGGALTVNQPLLGERLMLRASAFSYRSDGDLDNRWLGENIGDEDTLGGRLALRSVVGDFDTTLAYGYQRTNTNGLGYETLVPDLAAAGNVAPDPFDNRLALDTRTYDDVSNANGQLRVLWQPDAPVSLLSVTSYHDNNSPNLFDVDGSAVFLTTAGFINRNSETFSQEFRLTGTGDSVNWVAGAIVFKEDVSTTIQLAYSDINVLSGVPVSPADFGLPFPDFELCDATSDLLFGPCQASVEEISDQQGNYLSYGIYGDASWALDPQLTITAGLRYSADDKEFKYRSAPVESVTTTLNALNAAPLNPAGNLLGYSTEGWEHIDDNWDDLEARLALNYLLNDQASAYASVSRGYKAGGFEPAATPALSVFDPEQALSAELGLRGDVWEQRVNYQAGIYAYDVDDYQVQVIENGLARTVNTDGVGGYGAESQLQAVLDPHWQLQAAYAYTDARFKDFATDAGNLKNNRTILTPRHSGYLGLTYSSTRYDWGRLGLMWRTDYQGELYFTAQNSPQDKQDAFFRSTAQLSYFEPGARWQIDLIARNVFDENVLIFKQDVGAGEVARRASPRYIGLAFSGTF